MTKAEYIERYGLEWYEQQLERMKSYQKKRYHSDTEFKVNHNKYMMNYKKERYQNDSEFRESQKAYSRERYKNDPEFRETKKTRYQNDPEFRESEKARSKNYKKNDLNSNGKTKNSIRAQSRKILFKQRKHSKLKDYEIHHAFGYEDPGKFIYVPNTLHNKIHQFLRDHGIDADSNHYDYIKYMINECEEYTYISI